jgi:hypothetical protein
MGKRLFNGFFQADRKQAVGMVAAPTKNKMDPIPINVPWSASRPVVIENMKLRNAIPKKEMCPRRSMRRGHEL